MKWTLLDRVTKFQGFFRLISNTFEIQRFDGGVMTISREVFERGHAVGVLPYDPVTDQVVLVEQFRPGAVGFSKSPWLIELIAGMVEDNELPEEVACREAQEEAGCKLTELKKIAHYLVSPGGSTETIQVYVALCDSTSVFQYGGVEGEHEDIKVHVMGRSAFLERLQQGEINNGLTLIAAQWLEHHFEAWKSTEFKSVS